MTPENEIIFDFYKKIENLLISSQEENYNIDNRLGLSSNLTEKTYENFIKKIERSLNTSYAIKNLLNEETEFFKDVILGFKETKESDDKILNNFQLRLSFGRPIYKNNLLFIDKESLDFLTLNIEELEEKIKSSNLSYEKDKIKKIKERLKKESDKINNYNYKYKETFYIIEELKNTYSMRVAKKLLNELINNIEKNKEYEEGYKQSLINFKEIFSEINNYKSNLLENLKVIPELYYSNAELFKNNLKDNEISDFLIEKKFQNMIEMKLNLKTKEISKVILFKDNSILKIKNGDVLLGSDTSFYHDTINELNNSILEHMFRKHQNFKKFFKNILHESETFGLSLNYGLLIKVSDTFLNNKDILKENNFDIFDKNNLSLDSSSSLERLDDKMHSILNNHKLKRYMKNILGNKYYDLKSYEVAKLFKDLMEKDVTESNLKNLVGKKIALFKDCYMLEDYLEKLNEEITDFTPEILELRLKRNKIEPIFSKDNIVVFKVDKFEQSKDLGSTCWCISRDLDHFQNYKNNSNQYFIYDFNEKENSMYSKIGVTIYKNGLFRTSHLKDDSFYEINEKKKDLYLNIIRNDIDSYNLNEDMKELINKKEQKNVISINIR